MKSLLSGIKLLELPYFSFLLFIFSAMKSAAGRTSELSTKKIAGPGKVDLKARLNAKKTAVMNLNAIICRKN
ncbi:hypothetical protein [Aliifodinibius sp. S!AR15-10]|uniref:hypothetical protein n=1 Tax=Aliifodinibius sp. S!AR15-10 TaxID=2950437 RepID=UPI002870B1F5|nr:hypothetical protein [Aliifodinibius sp. S!AR15-10]